MTLHIKRVVLPTGLDRAGIRRFVVETFLDEMPGNDLEKEVYQYIVEECENNEIRILRQAWLNKGMDFKVNFEHIYFPGKRRTRNPSHQHIVDELIIKKNYDENAYKVLAEKIKKVYACEKYEGINESLRKIELPVGLLTPEEICLALKWLFIEQDITYWGGSGRSMLYNYLKENDLV